MKMTVLTEKDVPKWSEPFIGFGLVLIIALNAIV